MSEHKLDDIRATASASLVTVSNQMRDTSDIILLDRFISTSVSIGNYDHYKFFPTESITIVDTIRSRHGSSGVRIFLRCVLLRSLLRLTESEELSRLPEIVVRYHLSNLQRIALETGITDEWLDIDQDLFHKEFGLVSLRLISAGALVVDPRCTIHRSILILDGVSHLPRRALIFARLGGLKPYFQIHVHSFNRGIFNEHGWNECYRCCAELYKNFPKSLGMFGTSWFYDPSVSQISPSLKYLRDTPLSGGAKIIFYKSGGDAIKNSLAASFKRRNLYASGEYSPKNYTLIWGRSAQIDWADLHTND